MFFFFFFFFFLVLMSFQNDEEIEFEKGGKGMRREGDEGRE